MGLDRLDADPQGGRDLFRRERVFQIGLHDLDGAAQHLGMDIEARDGIEALGIAPVRATLMVDHRFRHRARELRRNPAGDQGDHEVGDGH